MQIGMKSLESSAWDEEGTIIIEPFGITLISKVRSFRNEHDLLALNDM